MNVEFVNNEIIAQKKILENMPIDQETINNIDQHIKESERELNERLMLFEAKVVIENGIPEGEDNKITKIDQELWNDISFENIWYSECYFHEELSFERQTKGYSFFYTSGNIILDVGFEDYSKSWYCTIRDDQRVKYQLTGAPVEIKLRAFKNLRLLLKEIDLEAYGFLPIDIKDSDSLGF